MSVGVKICGITDEQAMAAASAADYVGLVFFSASPRHLTPDRAAVLAALARPPVVAVTVDAEDGTLDGIFAAFRPAYLQLHGEETPERMNHIRRRYGAKIVKAIRVRSGDDVARARLYEDSVDLLMFDARPPGDLPGGTGISFDWRLLAGRSFAKPWFLSGGIREDNIEEAVRATGAALVDVSSGLESSPGVKDPQKIRSFIAKARTL